MGKLEELEEELYGKEGDEELAKRARRRMIFPGTTQKLPPAWIARVKPPIGGGKWAEILPKVILGFVIIFLIVGGATFIFLYLGTKGLEAELAIHGRETVEAGEIITIPIVFKNLSRTTLKEVELTAIFPADTLLIEEGLESPAPPRFIKKLEDLEPGREDTLEVAVRMFGRGGEEKLVETALFYRPENLRARFSTKASKRFVISRVPLAVFWEVPETLSRGQEVGARIRYTSSASLPTDDLSLRLEYPPGFTLKSSDPSPKVGDTIWEIGTLDPGKEGMVTLKGTISGEEGEIKVFRAEIGKFNVLTKEWRAFADSAKETKIAVAPLSIQGFLYGVRQKIISPGEEPSFTLRYKNNTPVTLKNLIVRAFLEGSILEFRNISIEDGGVFDSRSQGIVWSSGTTPELQVVGPGQGGELSFRVNTKASPAVLGAQDKNLIIRLRSQIEVPQIPQELAGTELRSDDVLEFKIRSKVIFAGRALYRTSPLLNFGSLPPKVGETTSYAITWEVRNFTNDLQNVEVKAALPPNIKWENKFSPRDARVIFDQGSGEVRWRIGEVRAGSGVISPAVTLAFQVSLIPSEADIGRALGLIAESHLTGTDTFTGESKEEKIGPLSTELREDPGTGPKDWAVVK